jgi:hypothetical protein
MARTCPISESFYPKIALRLKGGGSPAFMNAILRAHWMYICSNPITSHSPVVVSSVRLVCSISPNLSAPDSALPPAIGRARWFSPGMTVKLARGMSQEFLVATEGEPCRRSANYYYYYFQKECISKMLLDVPKNWAASFSGVTAKMK